MLFYIEWSGRASSDKVTFEQRPKQSRYLGEEQFQRTPSAKTLRQESFWQVLGTKMNCNWSRLKEEERTLILGRRNNGRRERTVCSLINHCKDLSFYSQWDMESHWEVLSRGVTWSDTVFKKDPSGNFRGIEEMFYTLIGVSITQVSTFVQTH